MNQQSAGAKFRQAIKESHPLAVVGCVNAYFARLATASGFKLFTCQAVAWRRVRAAFQTWASPRWKMY